VPVSPETTTAAAAAPTVQLITSQRVAFRLSAKPHGPQLSWALSSEPCVCLSVCVCLLCSVQCYVASLTQFTAWLAGCCCCC